MKLFDARKLATPGPITVIQQPDGKYALHAPGFVLASGIEDAHHAALLAHAYNMLPELVEALEAYVEADWQASGENSGVYGRHKLEELEKLIARAKENT